MAFALAPNAMYDPLFTATVPLVQEHATQIWEGRINPVRAHKAWVQRRSSKPSWHGVHGPFGAVIMSLRRIGWSFEKGVALCSDTDELINMLQTPQRRVAALVERGITRWQVRDAARSLAFDPFEARDIWLRQMRYMLYSPKGLGQLAKVKMYFYLVTGCLICRSQMTALNLRTDPSCSFCGYAQGTFAHQWHACPGMIPIASRREHAPILSHARVTWVSMKQTHPCCGPLESQACPNHRYLSLVRRRWQTGKRRMTLGWAIIAKGRLKLQFRVTWMVLHSTQRLLNFDVRDGVLLS